MDSGKIWQFCRHRESYNQRCRSGSGSTRIHYIWPDPATKLPKIALCIISFLHVWNKSYPQIRVHYFQSYIRIHYSQMWIPGSWSGSTSKWDGSPTLLRICLELISVEKKLSKIQLHCPYKNILITNISQVLASWLCFANDGMLFMNCFMRCCDPRLTGGGGGAGGWQDIKDRAGQPIHAVDTPTTLWQSSR